MNQKVEEASNSLMEDYQHFEKQIEVSPHWVYKKPYDFKIYPKFSNPYWYHPDHLEDGALKKCPEDIFSERASLPRWQNITDTRGFITQHMEYLPFGETLVEEHLNSNNSPYKFNAKQLDEETGWYYYGARYYNPKWSFFISVDPLAEKYPSISPYAYVANNPIIYIDPDGRQIVVWYQGTGYEYKNGNLYNNGEIYTGNNTFLTKKRETLNNLVSASTYYYASGDKLAKGSVFENLFVNTETVHQIFQNPKGRASYSGGNVFMNYDVDLGLAIPTTDGMQRSTNETALVHELGHSFSDKSGIANLNTWFSMQTYNNNNELVTRDIRLDEIFAMQIENMFREFLGEPLRTQYTDDRRSRIDHTYNGWDPKFIRNLVRPLEVHIRPQGLEPQPIKIPTRDASGL